MRISITRPSAAAAAPGTADPLAEAATRAAFGRITHSVFGVGATWDGLGSNFAVFSAHAQAVELCLFDASGQHEAARYALPAHTSDVWHGYLPDAGPGLIYGLRAHGPWRPERGYRFNAAKLLLDPYTRDVVGSFEWRDEHFGGDRQLPLHPDARDNAAFALKARVVDDAYDWEGDRAPGTRLASTVVYELHVKGFSRLNPDVPPSLRGTWRARSPPTSMRWRFTSSGTPASTCG